MEKTTPDSEPKKSRTAALVRACGWLTLILGLAFPLLSWGAVTLRGSNGVAATAVAGGIVWVASVASLVAASQFRGQQAINGVLLGMLIRMGPPLAACLVMPAMGDWLVKAGGLEILVIYYLLALAAETVLSVRLVKNDSGTSKAL